MHTITILVIGDVVGTSGSEILRRHLSALKKLYGADAVIVNGENSAEGNGITPASAEHLFQSGADVITGGNHNFRRKEIYPLLEENEYLLRPANYPASAPGRGMCVIDRGAYKIGVINLLGVVFMDSLESPFDCADRLIAELNAQGVHMIAVDIHAEATGEKLALAHDLDGRVSAVFGTHTHVQTADEQILPQGTGYITDIGMTGPTCSILGVKPEQAIARMKDKLPIKLETAATPCMLNAALISVDKKSGKALDIRRLNIT